MSRKIYAYVKSPYSMAWDESAMGVRKADVNKPACDDYEGHLKPWADCWNCGVVYRLHAEFVDTEEKE
jgi:hypothetical protein